MSTSQLNRIPNFIWLNFNLCDTTMNINPTASNFSYQTNQHPTIQNPNPITQMLTSVRNNFGIGQPFDSLPVELINIIFKDFTWKKLLSVKFISKPFSTCIDTLLCLRDQQRFLNNKLYYEARSNNLEAIRHYLAEGAGVNYADLDQWQCSHYVSSQAAAELLVNAGANIHALTV